MSATRMSTWPRVAALVALMLAGFLLPATAQERAPDVRSPSTLTVWNYPIVTFQASYGSRDPDDRAALARARIESLPITAAESPIHATPVQIGSDLGFLVRVGEEPAFAMIPGDVEPGVDLRRAADEAGQRLKVALQARADQEKWPVILRGVLHMLVATMAIFGVLALLQRLRGVVLRPVERALGRAADRVPWMHPTLRERLMTVVGQGLELVGWILRLFLLFIWITYVLAQFPLSAPLAERLADRFGGLMAQLGTGVVQALPGLFVAVVIFLIARAMAQLVRVLFALVSSGVISVRGLHRDTAHATERIVVLLVWVAAVLAAYPYIPGSDSDAFKGISLLFGVILSLGSAGLAGQAMSGLSAIYSRILRPGEFVRVGDDVEGQVVSIGMLATKICTAGREEVTIPNSVLLGGSTMNYSRLAEGGTTVSTAVGIGYDAPWRQVRAMMLRAAERTAGVLPDPQPRVFQRKLRSFDVEYVLFAFVQPGYPRTAVLSELNSNVLDAFNEYGVQIMTPAFESQPDRLMVVPPSRWHAAPAGMTDPRADVHGTDAARTK